MSLFKNSVDKNEPIYTLDAWRCSRGRSTKLMQKSWPPIPHYFLHNLWRQEIYWTIIQCILQKLDHKWVLSHERLFCWFITFRRKGTVMWYKRPSTNIPQLYCWTFPVLFSIWQTNWIITIHKLNVWVCGH